MDRGKVLWEEDLERLKGEWARYRDVDGDGIPYRTLPGNRHPAAAYFTRGTGHDENARYSEDNQVWRDLLARLKRKFETARQYLPAPEVDCMDCAQYGIIAFGSTTPAIQEARHHLAQRGIPTDYLRVRALPFAHEVGEFISNHEIVYVVEMNRDGQLHQLLTLEYPHLATRLRSIAYTDGLPLSASFVREAILAWPNKVEDLESKQKFASLIAEE
jgi:2-oxoglutarate ferredoxin oxidoreductase subunit alpha